jgi:hypothetical protein
MPELVLNKARRNAPAGNASERDPGSNSKRLTKPEWLHKFDAVRYRLGRDEVWVIGRLPGPVMPSQRRSAR